MTYNKEWKSKGSWNKKESKPLYKPKRGALKPLMSEEDKQKASIHELSYDFGCKIVRLYQYLTGEVQGSWSWVMGYSLEENQEPSIQNQEPFAYEYVMSKQIYRSGTSVGANVRESKHAQSDADFLSKMSIASKEADETDYWLNMLHDNGYLNEEQFKSLNNDCQRVIRVLISIVKTCSQKLKK